MVVRATPNRFASAVTFGGVGIGVGRAAGLLSTISILLSGYGDQRAVNVLHSVATPLIPLAAKVICLQLTLW
jgi:hypothetical protein